MIDTQHEVTRLEHQTRRLRDRLAGAWRSNRPSPVIRRIEELIEHRWRLLDRARNEHP